MKNKKVLIAYLGDPNRGWIPSKKIFLQYKKELKIVAKALECTNVFTLPYCVKLEIRDLNKIGGK